MTDQGPPASDHDQPPETPEARRARELLGEATLLRLRGRLEEAVAKCEEAIQLAADDWEACELLGDLHFQLEQPTSALEAYRRARELNPARPRLEEKVGLAAIAEARATALRQRSLDLAEGRIEKPPERKPALAALFSLVFPGLGQIYNQELIKGMALLAIFLVLMTGMTLSALKGLQVLQQSRLTIDPGAALSLFFQGGTLALTVLAVLVWAYAIIDAALQAGKSMTSDETGII